MILSSFSLVTHKMALPFNIPFNSCKANAEPLWCNMPQKVEIRKESIFAVFHQTLNDFYTL